MKIANIVRSKTLQANLQINRVSASLAYEVGRTRHQALHANAALPIHTSTIFTHLMIGNPAQQVK